MTTSKQYGAWATNSNAARKPKQARQNKLSISVKLLITMILVVVGTIGLCWLINNTFLEKYDFSGKKIILFATSGGSGFGNTVSELQPSAPDAQIVEGKLLNRMSKQEISEWVKTL